MDPVLNPAQDVHDHSDPCSCFEKIQRAGVAQGEDRILKPPHGSLSSAKNLDAACVDLANGHDVIGYVGIKEFFLVARDSAGRDVDEPGKLAGGDFQSVGQDFHDLSRKSFLRHFNKFRIALRLWNAKRLS